MAVFPKKQPKELPGRRQQTDRRDRVAERAAADTSSVTFRRNRTLAGSTSDKVDVADSTRKRSSDLESPRTQAHHLARRRRKAGGLLLAVLGGVLFFGFLVYQLAATPRVIVANGSQLSGEIDTGLYERTIDEYLKSNPFSRLRFALDVENLNRYVSGKLPEVATIDDVSFGSLGVADFTLTLRTPLVGWHIGDKQYFVDSHGVPFARNYFAAPKVQITDKSGISIGDTTVIASSRLLGFVGRVAGQAAKSGHTVTDVLLPEDTTRQIRLQLEGRTTAVIMSIDRPVGEQVEDMDRALAYLAGKNLQPEYIDVRVSGKAFYK